MTASDLTSEERDVALRVAQEMVEAHSRGELWIGIQSLRWAVDDIVAVARASARYCPGGIPRVLPEAFAGSSDRTIPIPQSPALAEGSARTKIDLPPGGVLGIIDPEPSDGIPHTAEEAACETSDDAQTGMLIDHTQPVLMPDGRLGVMKRSVGFPLDSAGGHGRSGEM